MTPPARTRSPWAVVCDFDGTATTEDIGDQVSQHFAGMEAWRRAEDEYRAGAYGFGTLIERIFAPITASREEIAAFARSRAVLRPGFADLVAACREAGRPFVVCSAGLDAYIEPVLEGLPADLRRHVQLRANGATCSPQGMRVEFRAAEDEDDGCGHRGFCKGTVVRRLQAEEHRVVAIGDGSVDRCAAAAADFVFATGKLEAWCRQRGIPHRAFEDFHQVMAWFPRR